MAIIHTKKVTYPFLYHMAKGPGGVFVVRVMVAHPHGDIEGLHDAPWYRSNRLRTVRIFQLTRRGQEFLAEKVLAGKPWYVFVDAGYSGIYQLRVSANMPTNSEFTSRRVIQVFEDYVAVANGWAERGSPYGYLREK